MVCTMFRSIPSSLVKGIEKITQHAQLVNTIFIALLIIGSFVFMAERFIGIAQTAEERLINVRVGALQDTFVSFVDENLDDPAYLGQKIRHIVATNETIRRFVILAPRRVVLDPHEGTTTAHIIIASNTPEEVGTIDTESTFLYSLAASNPSHSVTMPRQGDGERLFETGRAIVDETGEVSGVVLTTQTLSMADAAIGQDITSSRLLLFAVIALVLILFLRHSRIIDYVGLYKKLQEVDQLKDDFISMASHELRTPLTLIRGYAEYVSEAPELTTETRDYVAKIDRSGKELDALIADILDVSRIEQGRISYTLEKLNPSLLVEEVVTSFALPAREKQLAIRFDNSKVVPEQVIQVDAGRLKQNLINLVGNAIKYSTHGEVVVSQYVERGRLCLRVSDSGIGMTAEERAGLFGKFYRVRNEETSSIRGTGLGLWLTAKMVADMGGTISVESIKGVGSHFIISFPLATSA